MARTDDLRKAGDDRAAELERRFFPEVTEDVEDDIECRLCCFGGC